MSPPPKISENFRHTLRETQRYGRTLAQINETSTGTPRFLFFRFARTAPGELAKRQIYQAGKFANSLFDGHALIGTVQLDTTGDHSSRLPRYLMSDHPVGMFVNLRLVSG